MGVAHWRGQYGEAALRTGYAENMRISPCLELWPAGERGLYRGGELIWQLPDAPTNGTQSSDRKLPVFWDWSWRAVLRAQGPDARKWLHGMLTANVRDLKPGLHAPALALNARGHMIATLQLACIAADTFLLLTEETQRFSLYAQLRRYIIREKVEFCDLEEKLCALAIAGHSENINGPGLPDFRPKPGEIFTLPDQSSYWACHSWPDPDCPRQIYEWLAPPPMILETARQWTTGAGPRLEPAILQEQRRIEAGVPLWQADIQERMLPQEARQTAAVDFHKGCYLGQEIVERIRARGQVHRGLFRIRSRQALRAGDSLLRGQDSAGEVTSATALRAGLWAAMAILRHGEPGETLTTITGGSVTVLD